MSRPVFDWYVDGELVAESVESYTPKGRDFGKLVEFCSPGERPGVHVETVEVETDSRLRPTPVRIVHPTCSICGGWIYPTDSSSMDSTPELGASLAHSRCVQARRGW